MDIAAPIDIISAAGCSQIGLHSLQAVDMRGVCNQFRLRLGARWVAAIALSVLAWCSPTPNRNRLTPLYHHMVALYSGQFYLRIS